MLTLQQLAKLAQVSPSTVSKALNNSQDISAETRDRIVKLAAEHGYQKKFRQKSASFSGFPGPKIGLIYSDVCSRYYSKLIEAYSSRISAMGGVLLCCDAQFSTERAATLCRFLDQQCKVDGIVSIYGSSNLAAMPKTRAPLVGSVNIKAIETIIDGSIPCDYICCNAKTGLTQAFEYLVANGHRDIAFIGETHSHSRRALFEDAINQFGLPLRPELIRESNLRFEDAGFELMSQILREGYLPTAVVCSYDDIAVGAAKAIFGADLRIPEDISLLGYDNTRVRLYNQKMLASINSFVEEQAKIVMDMMMKRIADPAELPIQNVCLQTAFLPYETVGPAPGFQSASNG